MRRRALVVLFFFAMSSLRAQTTQLRDTLFGSSDPLIVTATRISGKLSTVAAPVTFVSAKQIRQSGLLRLQDVLQEQTGLAVVNAPLGSSLNGYPNPFGQGIQMMGLDPAYTLIMLDGEPLIGRNAGILNLGRITTGNIQQVEIVKGPSSSLYGSEAMAGVVNIITQKSPQPSLDIQAYHASRQTSSASVSFSNQWKQTGIRGFLHQYSTGGYDLDPNIYGNTQDPYRIQSGNLRIVQDFSSRSQLQVSYRFNQQTQKNRYQIQSQGFPEIVSGNTTEKDASAFLQWRYQFARGARLYFRSFFNEYQNNAFVDLEKTGTRFDENNFSQRLFKQEVQLQVPKFLGGVFVSGLGYLLDQVAASRYAGNQSLQTGYSFMQQEWNMPAQHLTLIAGARVDKREDFAARVSPRIALAWQPNAHWKITANAGGGFKAPDFRHLYLNFSNPQIGYSLLGAQSLAPELIRLQQQGLLQSGADITPFLTPRNLLPEYGNGIHLGTVYKAQRWNISLGLFHNEVNNLIDVYSLPFTRSNGLPIYSYRNAGRIYTQGAEIEYQYQLNAHWKISAGYQYLIAKDRDVLNAIQQQKIYRRDPQTYETSLLTADQYVGLANRSKHIANGKLMYENQSQGWYAFLRVVYRGAYGWMDVNGNQVIDDARELTPGFSLVNLSAAKNISPQFSIQAGIENLLNYTQPIQQPQLPGRQFFISLQFNLSNSLVKK